MIRIHKMTTAELVDQFTSLALEKDKAVRNYDTRRCNRLFDQMEAVEQELKNRPNDQRSFLLGLYKHPNIQVRMEAAEATLAIAPKAARDLLQEIVDGREFPQAGHAGMTLHRLDIGAYKPT
jgi:hypothetical protein